MNHQGNDPVLPTRRAARPGLMAVAMCTALSLAATQARAQTPAPAPLAPEPASDVPEPPELAPPPEPEPPPEPAPPPEPELPPEPAPPPEPVVGPAPAPAPEPLPGPQDPVRGQRLRVAGIGTMAAGGVISAVGFALTLAFTVQGRKRNDERIAAEDDRQLQDCSRMTSTSCTALTARIDDLGDQIDRANRNTQIAGATMLTGFAVLAVGGLVYRIGVRKLQPPALGRVKLSPSLGGVVLSGRF